MVDRDMSPPKACGALVGALATGAVLGVGSVLTFVGLLGWALDRLEQNYVEFTEKVTS